MRFTLFDRINETLDRPLTDHAERASGVQFAAAVLLVDVARADHEYNESEFNRVLQLIETHFELGPQEAADLVNRAEDRAERLVSVNEFTQFLHRRLDDSEKEDIVSLLWQVAQADGQMHPYEHALILKISDLLYVNRARCMRLKFEATPHALDLAV